MTGKFMKYVLSIFAILLLTGCADSVSLEAAQSMTPVGFWHGLWHGMTLPIAFIGSLFADDIAIYAIYNNGTWYDFGFVLGIGGLAGPSAI
jgi:TRAP-type C4-dicarboxylate transport system permease small subunit